MAKPTYFFVRPLDFFFAKNFIIFTSFIDKKGKQMKKSALTLAAFATLGICASLCNGAQQKTNPFIRDKEESFHSFGLALDINVPESFYPVHVTNAVEPNGWHHKEYRYYEQGKLNHYSQVYDALLKSSEDSDVYLYCYRVTLDPYQVRDWGFLGIGSNSDDWALYELETTVNFQKTISFGPQNTPEYEILNYAPKNNPSQYTGSIGFSVGMDSSGPSASISASVDYNHNELTVTSGTTIGQPFYKTNYVFRPYGISGYTQYLRHSVYCYGMVMFRYCYNVKLVVKHKIQYVGTAYYQLTGDAGKANLSYNLIY